MGGEKIEKPPYKPLTMQEVNDKKNTNGYNVVSTFSGAGGSCIGLKLAGFNINYAVEFIPEAQKTYQLNHTDTYLDKRDIRQIKGKEILNKIGLKKGELDLFEGSPPCSGFSQCGIGTDGWNTIKNYSDTKQRVDDLFFEFIRLINETRPKMILAENVPSLATGKNKGMLKLFINEFKKIGYTIKMKVLDASYLDVPQKRKRLIFIGKRDDLNININFPKPKKYNYITKDALPNFKKNKTPKSEYVLMKKETLGRELLDYAIKHHLKNLKEPYKILKNKEGYYTHRVLFEEDICHTLIQGSYSYFGYYPRTLSIFEGKRLHTFPDDFKLTGNYDRQWERIARSVPPRMYEAVGKCIKQSLDDYNDRKN
ncbi:DNA cytosine methyltransferase [Methanobrevibacter sp.]